MTVPYSKCSMCAGTGTNGTIPCFCTWIPHQWVSTKRQNRPVVIQHVSGEDIVFYMRPFKLKHDTVSASFYMSVLQRMCSAIGKLYGWLTVKKECYGWDKYFPLLFAFVERTKTWVYFLAYSKLEGLSIKHSYRHQTILFYKSTSDGLMIYQNPSVTLFYNRDDRVERAYRRL